MQSNFVDGFTKTTFALDVSFPASCVPVSPEASVILGKKKECSYSYKDREHPLSFVHICGCKLEVHRGSFRHAHGCTGFQVPDHFPLGDGRVTSNPGFCYLLGWHVASRPAVLSCLGIWPTTDEVVALLRRTPKGINLSSRKVRLDVRPGPDALTSILHLTAPPLKKGGRGDDPSLFTFLEALKPFKGKKKDDARVAYVGGSIDDAPASSSSASLAPAWINNPAPIAALGGVRQIPTPIVATQLSPSLDTHWTPELLPEQVTPNVVTWAAEAAGTRISVQRESMFRYHFPTTLNSAREPEEFRVNLSSTWMRRIDIDADSTIANSYNRNFRPQRIDRSIMTEFSAIARVLDNALDIDTLKEADAMLGYSRAMGSRGQRFAPNWEANLMARWQQTRDLAVRARATRFYQEFSFRLMSKFIGAHISTNLIESVPGYARLVPNTATNVQIIHINAETIPGVPAVPGPPPVPPVPPMWGEAAMWNSDVLDGFLQGRRQFVDAEGWSREDIAAVIGCLAPQDVEQLPRLTTLAPIPGRPRPVPEGDILMNVLRHTFPNEVTHIYVHHGSNPLPTPADAAWIQAHAFDFPSLSVVTRVIRSYSLRHGLGESFVDAFDAALYRSVGFDFQQAMGTDVEKTSTEIIDASGHSALYLPRNITISSYFDTFFIPAVVPPVLEGILQLTPSHIAAAGSLACHFRAVSLSWAAKAAAETGNVWEPISPATPVVLRNHHLKFLDRPYSQLNLWSTLFANAMATQYGFAPKRHTILSEENLLVDWWIRYMVPTLRNHYLELWAMKTIPTFQVLPYYDPQACTSHVHWAPGTPDQTAGLPHFQQDRKVRLAREFEPFPNVSWLGDGGAEYNAQFYAAQGTTPPANMRDSFCYENPAGIPKARFRRWAGQLAHSFPGAVANGVLHQFAPSGSHFSDFVLPGSLLPYRLVARSLQNWGVTESDANPLTDREVERWWRASKGEAHQSLMVNYRSPFRTHEQVDDLVDYSVVLWDRNNSFAGMTFMNLSTQLTKGEFDPVNTVPQQQPFSLDFDSRPMAFTQNQPSRIARSAPALPPDDLALRIATYRPQGRMEYSTKYPLHMNEVPRMDTGTAYASKEGISFAEDDSGAFDPTQAGLDALRDFDRPTAEVQAKLDRLRALEEEISNEWNATLAAQQQSEILDRLNRERNGESTHIPPFKPTPRVRAAKPTNLRRRFKQQALFSRPNPSALLPSQGAFFDPQLIRELREQPPVGTERAPITAEYHYSKGHRATQHPGEQRLPSEPVPPNDSNAAQVVQFALDRAQLMSQLSSLRRPASPDRPYRRPDPRPNRSDFAAALQAQKAKLGSPPPSSRGSFPFPSSLKTSKKVTFDRSAQENAKQPPDVPPDTTMSGALPTQGTGTSANPSDFTTAPETTGAAEEVTSEEAAFDEQLRIARRARGRDPEANRALGHTLPAGAIPLDFLASAPNEDAARTAYASYLATAAGEAAPELCSPKN